MHVQFVFHCVSAMMKREMSSEYEKQMRQFVKSLDSPQKPPQSEGGAKSPGKASAVKGATPEHRQGVLGPADSLIKLKVCKMFGFYSGIV